MATNYNLMEVPCQKAVAGASFSQGIQDYNFTIGRPNCVNMARSYFKIDLALETKAGVQPTVSNLVALADNCSGNLFVNAFFRGGGQDISTITSFLPQASQLKKRLGKTGAWLNSMGKSAQWNSASFATRCQAVSCKPLTFNESSDDQLFLKPATLPDSKISVSTAGAVVGVGTDFNGATNGVKVMDGDTLVVNQIPYTVIDVVDATNITLADGPAVEIKDEEKYYFIRRNTANTMLGKNTVSILWQPPLGIFDNDDLLGAGDYRISLVPDSNYQLTAVETNSFDAQSFVIDIKDIKFYAYQAKATIPEGLRDMGLTEIQLASKPITSGNSSLQFSVPPSTMYLTVFVQSNLVGSSRLYPSSLFKTGINVADGELSGDTTIESLQISYASINKPSTRWSSEFRSTGDDSTLGGINKLTQRYYDSFLEMNNMANASGGTESFGEWVQRGPFFHFVFARDLSDRATEVQLNINYRSVAQNTQCFLASWYHNTVNYTVAEGMITQVSSRQI